jgi:hypothetical protein
MDCLPARAGELKALASFLEGAIDVHVYVKFIGDYAVSHSPVAARSRAGRVDLTDDCVPHGTLTTSARAIELPHGDRDDPIAAR